MIIPQMILLVKNIVFFGHMFVLQYLYSHFCQLLWISFLIFINCSKACYSSDFQIKCEWNIQQIEQFLDLIVGHWTNDSFSNPIMICHCFLS